MKRKTCLVAPALIVLSLSLGGCTSRFLNNRAADFSDIWQLGVGYTTENHVTGWIPPSLGIHVQVTEFMNLGAVHFTGQSAEFDGRGTFVGPESRTRIGFGPYQKIMIDQNYVDGTENYFKKFGTLWSDRMNSSHLRLGNKPAKELNYEHWAMGMREGYPIMHRGWHYWENTGIEISLSDPFVSHFGFNFRLGVDVSEVSDFLLGWLFGFDFKHDDMTKDEFDELIGPLNVPSSDIKPASD